MIKNSLVSWFLCCFLVACADLSQKNHQQDLDYYCSDIHGNKRTCNSKEKSMIDGVRSIINQLKIYRHEDFAASFESSGDPLDQAQVLFFGEKHNEIISIIQSYGALSYLATPNDIILLEGSGPQNQNFKCDTTFLFSTYLIWEWEKLGKKYDPRAINEWAQQERMAETFKATIKSYDLSAVKLASLSCNYWDDAYAIKKKIDYQSLKERNESMVKTIKDQLNQSHRVFIVAGSLHLPMGEFRTSLRQANKKKLAHPGNYLDYYTSVKALKITPDPAQFRLFDSSGSTEPIYQLLIDEKLKYREFLHGKIGYR